MSNDKNRISLGKDAVELIRGLIVGEILSIMIIFGLWLWLRPRLSISSNPTPAYSQVSNTASAHPASTFQTVTNVPTGSFNYGGSTAWAPIRLLVDSQLQLARPELQLRYVNPDTSSPGSTSGIRMLLDGKLDFAQSSRPLTTAEYALAKQRGFALEQIQVAIDGLAVVVNPSLKVSDLTIDQLQQIYLGQITNWHQVGGPNLPITPFSQYPEAADATIFSTTGTQRQTHNSRIRYVYSTTEALRQVNRTPGGLYYASARAVVPQCIVKPLSLGHSPRQLVPVYREPLVLANQCPQHRNQLNVAAIENGTYPITPNLFVIIKRNRGREQQAGEAYARLLLTSQGQKAIAQAGFVPVR
ncbi:MAG: substrate-binding domain-containing protein [Chroococcidiopsidaceae cyanobacterium CP_BM_ER_R8_30]|nr:substrate-binding domain-containing protein [Chroococcidiopsidaceae cyanobacterium CP_BM_ER_R8_30]